MHGDTPARNIDLDTALADAEARYRRRTPRSAERYLQACASMPGGNTRSVLHFPPYPVTIERGEGASLWDIDGHHYRDFLGEYTAGLYGHSEPRILAAIRDALAGGIVLCAPNRFEVELATLMCERFPCCERVRFTNSGTEGNLMALGLARAATGRDTVMIFDGAYHGGVLYFAHGASPVNAPYPVVQGFYNDTTRTLEVIEQHATALAAILVEPMQGAGGCIAADVEFLRALREAADRHGVVLIFDEVMTSRLAPGGMQEATGVTPDLTSFGKYVGGGLSFGAFGGRADLMDRFDPRRADALPHAGTFNNNVLTMAAGLTGLRDIYTPAACKTLNALGERLRDDLDALAARRGFPLRVTGVGSILGLHFLRGPVRRVADADRGDPRLAGLFHLDMLEAGWYTARRGFMSLMLPLEDRDMTGFVAAVDEFMQNNAALADGAVA